jgi:thymidylate kinase
VIIDPHRYGIFFHISFLKLLFKIFPKPDLTIYLDAKSDTILKRSNELSKNLVKKNLIKYQKNLKNKKNIFFINSNKSSGKIKNDISQILLRYLTNKSNLILKKIK